MKKSVTMDTLVKNTTNGVVLVTARSFVLSAKKLCQNYSPKPPAAPALRRFVRWMRKSKKKLVGVFLAQTVNALKGKEV